VSTPNPSNDGAMEIWRTWMQLAPTNLVQPVLSGWTFNINSNNSTSPQTEANVVARHSYGRQLGRISDALRELLQERADKLPNGPLTDFMSMCEEIDEVKVISAAKRLKQISADLTLLKTKDEAEFRRVRQALELALKMSK
jgi:hypothetical protein